ncbi:hypothetical protein EDC01DRAFT_782731 [Geopyxis carbonaria]|nr:hypothetical protein EDC01DRAFT_782731 [Geopyxis carbonaria]
MATTTNTMSTATKTTTEADLTIKFTAGATETNSAAKDTVTGAPKPPQKTLQSYKDTLLDLWDQQRSMEVDNDTTDEALQEIENLIQNVKGVLITMIGEKEFNEWAFDVLWASGGYVDDSD